ncbi:CRISPR-associated endonuclease/helicase Cas3 [uncultured Gammaproteobacteria bacterium]
MTNHPSEIYAHSPKKLSQLWETLECHLKRVSKRCAEFSAFFGAELPGTATGMLHDIGKLRAAFQDYIRGKNSGAEHSICGAVIALEKYGERKGKLLAYVIAGHHGGMPDGGELDDRLAKAKELLADMAPLPEYMALPESLRIKTRSRSKNDLAFELHFLTRMLFSALVDADRLETERFYSEEQSKIRESVAAMTLGALAERLDRHILDLGAVAASEVLDRRAEVLRGCREGAEKPPGVFSLTVPTGGGKTLSSLAFALRHAEKHGLRRVIYVIPYTSIIEQTVDVFRTAFGDLAEAVIEHHSTAKIPEDKDREGPRQLAVAAAENWDAPVIVTTSVQFFESLYSNKPSRCRKLHNIAQSVVVLDEVQALPVHLLHPCVVALRELAEGYGASVVLCSATLPDWTQDSVFGREGFRAAPTELAPDVSGMFNELARVRCERLGSLDDEELAQELAAAPQVLCIVDSRPQAATLHDLVKAEAPDGTFHLSAAMCPAHRREVLGKVKHRLEHHLSCQLISTTVVEAGVDVDFPEVWRAAAGIDSLIQAAGRCNRNGKMAPALGRFVIFDTPRESALHDIKQRRVWAAPLLKDNPDPLKLETVRAWFGKLYGLKQGELDGKGILKKIEEGASKLNWPFRTIAEDFRLIDQATETVIVPWGDEVQALIDEVSLPGPPVTLDTRRKLQQFSVSVYPSQFKVLDDAGAISRVGTEGQFKVLLDQKYYDAAVGLTLGKGMRSAEQNIM